MATTRFYTRRGQVQLQPGQKLAFQRGKGYYAKGDPLLYQAGLQADAILKPQLQGVRDEQQRAQEQNRLQSERITGAAAGLAEILKGIAPATEQTYTNAANRTAAFGKGYSDAMQQLQQQSADQGNALLAQNNSPQTVAPTGGGDALYALGGAIPASSLTREGAAFTAAARQLPGLAAGRGQQDLAANVRAGGDLDEKFRDQLAKLEAERPGLVTQALNELRDLQFKQDAAALNEAIALEELGIKKGNLELAGERVRQGQTRLELDAANARIRALQNDRSFQLQLDRLGLQEDGLRLRAAELEAKRRNTGKGGFTAKQRRDMAQDAAAFAREAYQGWTDKDGQYHPPVSYQTVLLDMLSEGIPLVIAQRALNRYWQKPGQRDHGDAVGEDGEPFMDPAGGGRPTVRFQDRPRRKKKKR